MDANQAVTTAQAKFTQAVERFQESLKSLRTGRASASMLDGVMVEAYGTNMPLIQVGTVTAPEAQLIQISPFDPGNIQAISEAIRNNQALGLNPSDDGRVVRVPIPALTEERRRELAKQISQKQEEAMIGLRSIRHEAIDAVDKAKKDKQIGDAMSKAKASAEAHSKAKEQELLTI
jgi:ribosome recycling factor